MGLLSKQAIQNRLNDGSLTLEPAPGENDFDSDAVNVHLGDHIYEWAAAPSGSTVSIALWREPPSEFRYTNFAKEYLRRVPFDNTGVVTLRPHTFYLADLREHTRLPSDVAMHVQGKSSLARLGIMVHLTAPHAHAGWEGLLTLEIYNLGPFNIELKPGMTIGQLTFWRVEEPCDAAQITARQFSNQANATGSST